MSEEASFADNAGEERYEVRLGDELAGALHYSVHGERISLDHTEIYPAFEGQGLGGGLISFALDDARSRSLQVLPRCPFVRAYIERHPEYLDLVPERARPRFGL